jgi:hypothetical protein
MAEIVIDPEVPGAVQRELEQAPLSALVGFGDPVPGPELRDDPDDDACPAVPPSGLLAANAILLVVVVLAGIGLSSTGPFAADLVFLGLLLALPCAALGCLHLMRRASGPARARRNPAVAYHRRYVVPELDLHDEALARWRRASAAARTIRTSETVRRGLVDTVEVTAVLPYHLWDVAERLALLSAPQRRQASILHGLDPSDPDIQAVLEPQLRVYELAVADIERRIGRLEEFAALAAGADHARRRRRAIEELAALNPDYAELLVRLDEPGTELPVTGGSADELRAVLAVETDEAVRRANDAGLALVIPGSAR